jgi:multiple sugar transport system ATP-binding protein
MAEVVLRRVSKAFPGGTLAVDDVSLDIADGEFVVLVGPSGCGKSTLLRMVAGLEEATSGTIAIDGEIVDDLPPKARDVAMVFQNYALYPHMTVAENLSFSLRLAHLPKENIAERVAEVAHVLGLLNLLDRKPKALSGGQRQRVAMGRAIVRQPRVFLMDEPLSNLDAKLRVAMRAELTRLHHRYRTTTIYVTHDQVEAMTLGDRIAVLDRGRLQQVGTPEELYDSPCNTFVAGFIGSPAMNMTRAVVIAAADGLALRVGDDQWPLPAEAVDAHPGIADLVGRDVVVGLRPHQLSQEEPHPAAPQITVRPVTVESLGHEVNVLFVPPFGTVAAGSAGTAGLVGVTHDLAGSGAEGADLWTAKLDVPTTVRTGVDAGLYLDLRGAYFFDAESTRSLAAGTDHIGYAHAVVAV